MLKKLLLINLILALMIDTMLSCTQNTFNINFENLDEKPVKIAVLLYSFDDIYLSLYRKSLEQIQKENEGKVEFTFYDGKSNKDIQDETLDKILKGKSADIIALNLIDSRTSREAINKIKENNIPVIFLGGEIIPVASYEKAYLIGTSGEEGGNLQGKILVDAWNSNKENIDKNQDNIMQYIMLMGRSDSIEARERTEHSVKTINNSGIKTQELELKVSNWSKEEAYNNIKSLFLKYKDKIEVIIANNDAMAIGAIQALQEYGYNKGDKEKTITVVGIDGIPEAQELIKNGFMTGTVIQDTYELAKALYLVGMNLAHYRKPLEGTNYQFAQDRVSIIVPYKGVLTNMDIMSDS